MGADIVKIIEIAIEPDRAAEIFKVKIFSTPAGEASAIIKLDLHSLMTQRELLQQAVQDSAARGSQLLPDTDQPVRKVGQILFDALLGTGEVGRQYKAAEALAADSEEKLRVVLRIDTQALAGLPWEAMYDQGVGAYVCRRHHLVRHVPVASVPTPLPVRPPLRILGVVSCPGDLCALDVTKEQEQLTRALTLPISQGLVELHWAPSATWANLQDLLLDGNWHALHFIGHGGLNRDEGVVALTREDDGNADLVAARRLTDLLHQADPMPRLVALNSCSGAATGVSDLFSGTATALVRGGVSAVVAMQFAISDPAAAAFAYGFYSAIARRRGVDDAVSSGRAGILGLSNWTLEWVTPVLYLRGHDARLFALPASTDGAGRVTVDTQDVDEANRIGSVAETSLRQGQADSAPQEVEHADERKIVAIMGRYASASAGNPEQFFEDLIRGSALSAGTRSEALSQVTGVARTPEARATKLVQWASTVGRFTPRGQTARSTVLGEIMKELAEKCGDDDREALYRIAKRYQLLDDLSLQHLRRSD
jgi:hypothetical protein